MEGSAKRSERDSDSHRRRSVLAWRRHGPGVYGFKYVPRQISPGAAEPFEPGWTSTLRELPVTSTERRRIAYGLMQVKLF